MGLSEGLSEFNIGPWQIGILALAVVLGVYAWRNPGHWTAKAVIVLLILNVISNIFEPAIYKQMYGGEAS